MVFFIKGSKLSHAKLLNKLVSNNNIYYYDLMVANKGTESRLRGIMSVAPEHGHVTKKHDLIWYQI